MLKDILKQKGMSVYKLSKLSGVPYTTVNEIVLDKKKINDCKVSTIISLARALNISNEELLENKSQNIATTWLDAKKKRYSFPIIIENNNFEINRIHPLNQKRVNTIYNIVSTNKNIKTVIVFGSSTNITCNKKSDVDIMIELNNSSISEDNKNIIEEEILNNIDSNVDIIWKDKLNKETEIYKNIMRGVTIYEQTTSKSKS